MVDHSKRVTVPELRAMKQRGEKVAALTAYDASFALLLDQQGIDVILVGDSLGMVIQGAATTLPVTLDDLVYHSRWVSRASQRALLVADLPFMSYPNPERAADAAARLIGVGGVHMVKLEGGRTKAPIISYLVEQNIPVCGHLGLLPQSIHRLGGYAVQARDELGARHLLEDALILQQAGISLLILECVPAWLGEEVSHALEIPVIGIGAGAGCDGQVLVLYDMLGISAGKAPHFVKNFLIGADDIADAVRDYAEAVRAGLFPTAEHSY